jgi:hypothetical protein
MWMSYRAEAAGALAVFASPPALSRYIRNCGHLPEWLAGHRERLPAAIRQLDASCSQSRSLPKRLARVGQILPPKFYGREANSTESRCMPQ